MIGILMGLALASLIVLAVRPDWRARVREVLRTLPARALAIPALIVAGALIGESVLSYALFAAAFLLFCVTWVGQFTFLMKLPDDAFPGRNDKLIWAILLIVLPPVGLLVFGSYREAHWPASKPVTVGVAHDLV